ncbi:MAG: SRPBCC domain-containing protein [Bacteroidetes bacterium]|nr:SRPBCC domain-containing protein [Bacteroidota bacterium]MCB9056092.1 SRPBCC domain-containing protein [Chitinophagales bacterium]
MSINKTQIIANEGQHDFKIIREFSASKENVFRAFAEPDLLNQWFMPEEMCMKIEIMECRTGGSFYHTHIHSNGMKFGFRGVYHEVDAPIRIIKTSEFVGLSQKVQPVLETTTFETSETGNTKVTVHTICPSAEYRDAMIQNGMEQHLQNSYQLLDKVLNKL